MMPIRDAAGRCHLGSVRSGWPVHLENQPKARPQFCRQNYLSATGGPLTRLALRSTVTSTRSAILMKGMLPLIP